MKIGTNVIVFSTTNNPKRLKFVCRGIVAEKDKGRWIIDTYKNIPNDFARKFCIPTYQIKATETIPCDGLSAEWYIAIPAETTEADKLAQKEIEKRKQM